MVRKKYGRNSQDLIRIVPNLGLRTGIEGSCTVKRGLLRGFAVRARCGIPCAPFVGLLGHARHGVAQACFDGKNVGVIGAECAQGYGQFQQVFTVGAAGAG